MWNNLILNIVINMKEKLFVNYIMKFSLKNNMYVVCLSS